MLEIPFAQHESINNPHSHFILQGGLDCAAVWRLNETTTNSDLARVQVTTLAAVVRDSPTACVKYITGQARIILLSCVRSCVVRSYVRS